MALKDLTYSQSSEKSELLWFQEISKSISYEDFMEYKQTRNRLPIKSQIYATTILQNIQVKDKNQLNDVIQIISEDLYGISVLEKASLIKIAYLKHNFELDKKDLDKLITHVRIDSSSMTPIYAYQLLMPNLEGFKYVEDKLNKALKEKSIQGTAYNHCLNWFKENTDGSDKWNIEDNRVSLFIKEHDYKGLANLVNEGVLPINKFIDIFKNRTIGNSPVTFRNDAESLYREDFRSALLTLLEQISDKNLNYLQNHKNSYIDDWLTIIRKPELKNEETWKIWWRTLSIFDDKELLDFNNPTKELKSHLAHLEEAIKYAYENPRSRGYLNIDKLHPDNKLVNKDQNLIELAWFSLLNTHINMDKPSEIKITPAPWMMKVSASKALTNISTNSWDNTSKYPLKTLLYLPFLNKEELSKLLPNFAHTFGKNPVKGLSLTSLKSLWNSSSLETTFDVKQSIPRTYIADSAFLYLTSNRHDPKNLMTTMKSLEVYTDKEIYCSMVNSWLRESYGLNQTQEQILNMDFTL